jgi:hypothetical protein
LVIIAAKRRRHARRVIKHLGGAVAMALLVAFSGSGASAQFRVDDCSKYGSWFPGRNFQKEICEHQQRMLYDPIYRRQMEEEALAAGAAAELEDAKRKAALPPIRDPGAVDLCPKPHRMTDDGCQ